jgi:hypothetical protein
MKPIQSGLSVQVLSQGLTRCGTAESIGLLDRPENLHIFIVQALPANRGKDSEEKSQTQSN